MAKLVALIPFVLLASGCSRSPGALSGLSEEFVNKTLSFSPSAATAAGLHVVGKDNLDDMLDDLSPASLDKQRLYYQGFRNRLGELKADQLTPEDQADVGLMRDQCSLQIQELTEVQSAVHNPTLYTEIVGQALFTPFVLEYAPKADRIRHIMARLQKIPLLLSQAATNLIKMPPVWTQLALAENQANLSLVDETIRADVPANLRDAYARAAMPALSAMHKYEDFLKSNTGDPREADWRLGARYSQKFRFTMNAGTEADSMLQAATLDMAKMRAHMMELALPLHAKLAPAHHDHTELSGDARENKVVGEVLAHIAERHSTRDSYLDDARKYLEEARAFVQEKHLLTLPAQSNLQVIPTPEFERSVYATGGFVSAPPLEPRLGAFYWITPIPKEWSDEQAESKLREYNEFMLRLVTLHEAIPGHYVQFEIANGIQPPARRVLRAIYGSGPYVEGWAQYSEQAMLEAGYLNHSPELELTFAKQQLRVVANAILDVRLQMLNMTDAEALEFLEKQAFQEHQEAVEKLQRAKATSTQLPTYYVGWKAWVKLREEYKNAKGAAFSLADFHDRALREGPVPLSALGGLLQQAEKQP